jgi:multisubunit Na+/H+ antiporter MnhF subunit
VSAFHVAATILIVALLLPGYVCLRARALDAIVALELIGATTTVVLLCLAEGYHRDVYFAVALVRSRRDARVRRCGRAVVALVLAQMCVGLLNAALLAPVWMQIVHLLVADLLWLALVLLSASSLARGEAHAEEFEQVSFRGAIEI